MKLNIFFTLFSAFLSYKSFACSRVHLELPFLVAMADEIVIGGVTGVPGEGEALIEVKEWLKKGSKSGKTKLVKGIHTSRKSRFSPCQSTVIEKGLSYMFFLQKPYLGEAFYRSIDLNDGVFPPNSPRVRKVAAVIALKGQASGWKKHSKGIQVKLLSSQKSYLAKDDINLMLLVRNSGPKDVVLNYKTWPPREHSHCQLKFSQGKDDDNGRPVPISKEDILTYFSKHGHQYDRVLKPKEIHHIRLEKVNTAKPGWGYKELLGFKYFPLTPGEYAIKVECPNFFYFPLRPEEILIEVKKG